MATNFYNTNTTNNKLPGQGSGFAVQPTFDPNTLPGAKPSFQGGQAFASKYTDGPWNVNTDPFTSNAVGGEGFYMKTMKDGSPVNTTAKDPTAPSPGQAAAAASAPTTFGGPTSEAPLAGPGYQEDWYKTYGNDLMTGVSASEDLYSRGAAGSNPFYDYAQEQAIKAINDAAAARGGFNSSFTMKTIGNAVADLRGQQAHELGMLAGQADQGRFGRYDRGNEFSGDAQRAMENRARGGLQSEFDLASGRAGLVGDFYGEAGRENLQARLAQIEVLLKKSGLDAAQIQQALNVILQAGGVGASLGGGLGGGGGGGGGYSPAKM